MDGTLPLAPDFYWSTVHVRDVALAHILALETPQATGRYIVADETTMSMLDIASERPVPLLLLKAIAIMGLPSLGSFVWHSVFLQAHGRCIVADETTMKTTMSMLTSAMHA